MQFKTIADVRAANAAAGYCWFSRETMRFWKTRIESSLIAGRWFITSEDEWTLDGRTLARIYCVRQVRDDGGIDTIKSHLRTKADAKDVIHDLKAGWTKYGVNLLKHDRTGSHAPTP